jgi:hypothetical protein
MWMREYSSVSLIGNGFFADAGIPLAVCRPELYDQVLEQYFEIIRRARNPIVMNSQVLLAFALCWDGRPELGSLSQAQLRAIRQVADRCSYLIEPAFGSFGLPTRLDEIAALLDRYQAWRRPCPYRKSAFKDATPA